MNSSAEQIQCRMNDLRAQLDSEVEGVVECAKTWTHWHKYVERYPWACFGVAAAIGYLVVPARVELKSPDVDTLLQLAKKNKLVVEANPSPQKQRGIASQALLFLSHAAVRGGLTFLERKVGEWGSAGHNAAGESE